MHFSSIWRLKIYAHTTQSAWKMKHAWHIDVHLSGNGATATEAKRYIIYTLPQETLENVMYMEYIPIHSCYIRCVMWCYIYTIRMILYTVPIPGARLSIKTPSYQYRDFQYKDKTVSRQHQTSRYIQIHNTIPTWFARASQITGISIV